MELRSGETEIELRIRAVLPTEQVGRLLEDIGELAISNVNYTVIREGNQPQLFETPPQPRFNLEHQVGLDFFSHVYRVYFKDKDDTVGPLPQLLFSDITKIAGPENLIYKDEKPIAIKRQALDTLIEEVAEKRRAIPGPKRSKLFQLITNNLALQHRD